MSRCGFRGKNTLQKRLGTKDSVRCSEFRGGRFSEVANVLQVWDFQSVTRTLSALGSVSASRSVRSGRFYCIRYRIVSVDMGYRFLHHLSSQLLVVWHVKPRHSTKDWLMSCPGSRTNNIL